MSVTWTIPKALPVTISQRKLLARAASPVV
jgi:hypothetical protein